MLLWRRVCEVVSFLALWSGLYVAAGVVAFAQLAGMWRLVSEEVERWVFVVGCAVCAGTGVYLLDRVKVADRWVDPADRAAHPARAGFLARHVVAARVVVVVLVGIGAGLGGMVSAWVAPIVVGACIGVLVYAGRPRGVRARPKDVLIVKNACVAGAITVFAGTLCVLAAQIDLRSAGTWSLLVMAGVQVMGRVFADAVLSDLDDEAADRAFATATLATRYGRERAWNIAMVIRLWLAAALLAVPVGELRVRVCWAVVTVVSTLALRLTRPSRVRDWVDVRFVGEVVVVGVLMWGVGP